MKKNSERPVWLLLLIVFLVSCGSGLAFSYWKNQSMLERQIQGQLKQAVRSVEAILGHAHSAAEKGAMYAGKTCTDVILSDLRAYVAAIPDVRSINLAKENQIYCTTVYGSRLFTVDDREYTRGRLLLLNGNELTPYRSLIVYRAVGKKGNSVLAGVDGYYLYSILKLIDSQSNFYIKVGDKYMTRDGAVIPSPATETILSQGSLQFPFSVIADTSQIYTLKTFLQYSWDTIVIVIVFSLLTCFLASRYLLYRKTLEARLHKAIKHEEISPWIQPVYDAEDETIAGGEILLRWFEPGNGFIPPDVFIRLAEENGTIQELTRACFQNTARELKSINTAGNEPLMVCFNVTACHFRNSDILSLCDDFVREMTPECFRIVLEVTEREIVTGTLQTQEIIRSLKERRIALSLDDFGTGNANYSYIKLFSPDYLKIDKMFTSGIESDTVSQFVVASIIDLARKLGCDVIAEGVETLPQKEMLRAMGVTHFQGYYFSKPVPLHEFKTMLTSAVPVHNQGTAMDV
ncbi:cyclic diguanylate phosphodiesterase [Enterobacter ludwigii]|uniref:cyclic diguanylate phosphodiesterase n=1 Tax=Enterobacter ludwigii TaxID=299767 RepID=UPI00273E42B4|nr:cyclic diguanylate phosphodiesterase [Enterobacter ludwigii]MDP5163528.1 cyclic diguanylate phosphodiesterase [Enterobacter ludwigii]